MVYEHVRQCCVSSALAFACWHYENLLLLALRIYKSNSGDRPLLVTQRDIDVVESSCSIR
jgi:hypothetical protein